MNKENIRMNINKMQQEGETVETDLEGFYNL